MMMMMMMTVQKFVTFGFKKFANSAQLFFKICLAILGLPTWKVSSVASDWYLTVWVYVNAKQSQ